MWLAQWRQLLHVAIATSVLFVTLVALIRVVGARSIASLTPFDFVIVVAVGNLLATVAVTPSLPILHAVVGMAVLFGLQWFVDFVTSRSKRADRLITGRPKLLFYEGFLDEALVGLRLTPEDVLQAMRSQGFAHQRQVLAVVLETNGTMTVIGRPSSPDERPDSMGGTLPNVRPPTGQPSAASGGS